MKWAIAIMILLTVSLEIRTTRNAKKILLMPCMTAPSHVKSMLPLARALRKDGHNVSFVQYYADEAEKISDKDIPFIYVPTYGVKVIDQRVAGLLWREKQAHSWRFIKGALAVGADCRHSRNDSHNADFYHKVATNFWDLLIIDNVCQPCGMILSTTTKNEVWVDYSTTPMFKWSRRFRAVNLPLSVDITGNAEQYEPRCFINRLISLLDGIHELTFWTLLTIAMETQAEGIPIGKWRARDFYTNAVYSIGSLPSTIEIALPQTSNTFMVDYECPKPAKLGKDYLEFIEHPTSKGTIIFAFGHFVEWKAAPAEVVKAFSSAFEDLPQYRIIWQFNGDPSKFGNKSHIKMEPWVPLAAIMQHPKTVLFITHAGIKSFREAICFAIPIVTVPIFGDQPRLALLSSIHGFGVRLDKTKLSKEAVYNAITAVAENSKYKRRVTKFNAMVSDTIINDTSKGKFWINFYLRHPGSIAHMRLKGVRLNFCTYSCYDLVALVCILVLGLRSALEA